MVDTSTSMCGPPRDQEHRVGDGPHLVFRCRSVPRGPGRRRRMRRTSGSVAARVTTRRTRQGPGFAQLAASAPEGGTGLVPYTLLPPATPARIGHRGLQVTLLVVTLLTA